MPTKLIKRHSTVEDAIAEIKKVAIEHQNSESINAILAQFPFENFKNPLDWFKVVFAFLFSHVQYKFDDAGKEQIKTPDRFFKDKEGDCDDYSTFWSTILTRLKIKHFIRIVKYKQADGWAHVYVWIPINDGKNKLVLDNVYAALRGGLKRFGQEIDHIEEKDF